MKFRCKSMLLIFGCSLFYMAVSAQNSAHALWSAQGNIYEVNVRQFTPEGTFNAFEKHLKRLKNMGVEILCFLPVTPIGREGAKMITIDPGSYYAVKNYTAVNKELGTVEDWKMLVKNAHRLGLRVIIDWVASHSSADNDWVTRHPDFYSRDSLGNFVMPHGLSDTRKLNYENRELRDSMIAAMQFWIKESDIDGFRCNMAGDVPLDFWKDCITALKKLKNVFMLAEADKPELHLAGFDATCAWGVMGSLAEVCAGKKSLAHFDSSLNNNIRLFPPNAYRLYVTSSHNLDSLEGTDFERNGDAYKPIAVFTQTMYQSVPLVYNGKEAAGKKDLKPFVKDSIRWGKYEMMPFKKTLLTLRQNTPALAADAAYKKLVTANDIAIFAYLREKNGHKVAVILNLSNQPQRFTIKESALYGSPMNVFLAMKENLSRTYVYSMEPWGYIVYDYDR